MKNLYWKSKFSLKSQYEIFDDEDFNNKVGQMTDDSWLTHTTAELNSKKYKFRSQGFFNNKTEIFRLDLNSYKEEKIGEIEINIWRSKAEINIYKHNYNYEYTNLWNTKSKISNQTNRILINSENNFLNNKIEINEELMLFANFDNVITSENIEINAPEILDILSLTSIYINNYFMYVLFTIIFIMVLISGISNS